MALIRNVALAAMALGLVAGAHLNDAVAGEDLMLLTPAAPPIVGKDGAPASYPVNIVRLTLPPVNQPEKGIVITQDAPYPDIPVEELQPFELVTDIPGLMSQEAVTMDTPLLRGNAPAAPVRAGRLPDLPAQDAFPVINMPLESPGVSPALPDMPVYGDKRLETLEAFVPEAVMRTPRPERVQLPRPLERGNDLASDKMPAITASFHAPGLGMPPPAMPLTATLPVFPPGFMGPPEAGMRLTDSFPVAGALEPRPRKRVERKTAPPIAERTVPTVSGNDENGFTNARSMRNLLGQAL